VSQLLMYTVSWSSHCREAERVLADAKVSFRRQDVSDMKLLSTLSRDLGIRKLPVLTSDSVLCEGLDQIVSFVRENGWHMEQR